MIDRDYRLSVSRQCQVLGLPRSTAYYQPVPVSTEEQALMRRIDELHLEIPSAGSRTLRTFLRNDGYQAGRQRIRRLMCKMGGAKRSIASPTSAGDTHRIRSTPICCGT